MSDDRDFFICPECSRISYNPEDISEGYCGYCHAFTRDLHESLAELDRLLGAGRLDRKAYDAERTLLRKTLR